MRAVKAKAIRRLVYGDKSHRAREYKDINGPFTRYFIDRDDPRDDPRKFVPVKVHGTLVNKGLRFRYKAFKFLYKTTGRVG